MRLLAFLLCLLFAPVVEAKARDCGDEMTTVDMTECYAQKAEATDAELNKVYQAVIAEARKMHGDFGGVGTTGLEENIRKAQRAWNDWHVKDCAALSQFEFTSGSGRGPAYESCRYRLLRERVAYYQNLLKSAQ